MSEKTRGKKKVEEKVELIATRRPEDRRLTLFGLLSLNRTLAQQIGFSFTNVRSNDLYTSAARQIASDCAFQKRPKTPI